MAQDEAGQRLTDILPVVMATWLPQHHIPSSCVSTKDDICSLSADNILAYLGVQRLRSDSRAVPGYCAAASSPHHCTPRSTYHRRGQDLRTSRLGSARCVTCKPMMSSRCPTPSSLHLPWCVDSMWTSSCLSTSLVTAYRYDLSVQGFSHVPLAG